MEIFGRIEVDKHGKFTFPCDSARVFINVLPWRETSTLVTVYAYTNIDVPLSDDLYRFVAQKANSWAFGRLGMTEGDGKALIMFDHSLLGDYLDVEELRTAAYCVAWSANNIDDEIKRRFGGTVFHDARGVPVTNEDSQLAVDEADPRDRYGEAGYL